MPPPSGVQGLVVLVTGGTSGIGLASVRALLEGGARVAFTGRRAALGASLAAGHEELLFIEGDVTVGGDRDRAVAAVLSWGGRLDVLFNCAGIVQAGSVAGTSEEAWGAVLDVNLTAVWAMTRAVLPVMLASGGGNIINCASDWALVGARGYAAYCVSKAGVVALTRCTALEHARAGIRCNAVCPGDTLVERWGEEGYARGGSGPVTPAQVAADGDELPLGRVADVSEVAAAVVFLASRGCAAMTGTTLVVDGGNTAQ